MAVSERTGVTFGPVPSRRLGRSLGINNIPAKRCTYGCVYCQLGPTMKLRLRRHVTHGPERVRRDVEAAVETAVRAGVEIDYLTFVPDGEPTLDVDLGREIDSLRPLGIPVAVISNASLISLPDVRDELARADWVSLKVDSTREKTWRRINRPHHELRLDGVLEGVLDFARSFDGQLVTETMLVRGLNDDAGQLGETGRYLARVAPSIAYLAVPTRPPAVQWVEPPDPGILNRAFHVLSDEVETVEYLIGYEGTEFTSTGDVGGDLLAITSVHPMRRDQVDRLLEDAGADWSAVQPLVEEGEIVEIGYRGHRYYLRKIRHEA